MLLRAIIIDQDLIEISRLRQLIERFAEEIKVVAECTEASKGITLIEDYLPDIVFLEINMPDMNGFELLERLSWRNFNLVFVTANCEYGLKAMKYKATDYLLKPVKSEDLRAAVQKIIRQMLNGEGIYFSDSYAVLLSEVIRFRKKRILIHLRSGIEPVDINEIIFLESKASCTKIHLNDLRIILTSKPLKEFENSLCVDPGHFMRVHRSFIINLHKIARYQKVSESITVGDTHKIPLAKTKKEAFLIWLKSLS